jgi:hypothetical protein
MAKLTKKLQQIRSTLKSNLESVRAMGGDKTKIDTTEEKNKVAELLAGAQEEIGDLFKHTTTQEDVDIELKKELIELEIAVMKSALSNSLEPYEKYDSEGGIKRAPNVKHIFKDGSWDRKLNDIENVGYVAELMNSHGDSIGSKLYKNDKEIYTNPDFVAKHLGLQKKEDSSWGITKVFSSKNSIKQIPEGYYYVPRENGEFDRVYQWDDKTHSFKLSNIDRDRNMQRIVIDTRLRDNVDRYIDDM